MAKGGKGQRRSRRMSGMKFYQDALNEVMLSVQPLLNQVGRAQLEGRQDFQNSMARYNQVYNALGNDLSGIAGQYGAQTAGIAPQLASDIGGLSSMLGADLAPARPGEEQAGLNMAATLGAGAMQNLASNQMRNASYNASAQRQGAIEKMTSRRNARTDWQDYKQQLANRRTDIMESVPSQVQQVMRNMSNDAFNRRMSLRQLGLQERGLDLQEEAIQAEKDAAAAQAALTRRLINKAIQYSEAQAALQGYQNPYTTMPGSTANYPRPDYSSLPPVDTGYTNPYMPTPSGNGNPSGPYADWVGTWGNISMDPTYSNGLSNLWQWLFPGMTPPNYRSNA